MTIKFPTSPRWKYVVTKSFEFLTFFNLQSLPLEPLDIIQRQPWRVRTYGEYAQKMQRTNEELSRIFGSADGITLYEAEQYTIFYNENINLDERIRFTLQHEIGHIVLEHLEEFQETILTRGGLTKAKYEVLEKEANYFATLTLAPPPIIADLGWSDDFRSIAHHCGLSYSASTNTANGNNFRLRHLPLDSSQKLLEQFSNYIYRIKFRSECNNCNADFSVQDANYCPICGSKNFSRYHYVWSVDALDYSTGIPSDENNKALVCPKCQNEDTDRGDFCPICGLSLINSCSHKMINCPSDTPLSVNDRFCPHCGAKSMFFINGAIKEWDYIEF